jgi:hypothetical protein
MAQAEIDTGAEFSPSNQPNGSVLGSMPSETASRHQNKLVIVASAGGSQ